MKPCVLYFSRTGRTKFVAVAIANAIKTPSFNMASSEPSVVEDFDMIILGTPVEGFRPAKETLAFVEQLPKAEGKKVILFCTYALAKGSTLKILEQELASKGYNIVLSISKRGIRPNKTDLSETITEIEKAL
jgi:flavodoxin